MNLHRRIAGLGVAICLATGAGATAAMARTPASTSARAAALLAAKDQWIAESPVGGGALQAVPFEIVVADLRQAIADGANRTTYERAIANVLQIGSLPDSMLTSAQESEFMRDTTIGDQFFGIAHNPWSKGCLAHGPGLRAAGRAWAQEPGSAHHGVSVAPLKAAVTALTGGEKTDAGDRTCYPAAILDLEGLEHATAAQISAAASYDQKGFTDPSAGQIVDMEILWLNDFLGLNGMAPGSSDRL